MHCREMGSANSQSFLKKLASEGKVPCVFLVIPVTTYRLILVKQPGIGKHRKMDAKIIKVHIDRPGQTFLNTKIYSDLRLFMGKIVQGIKMVFYQ